MALPISLNFPAIPSPASHRSPSFLRRLPATTSLPLSTPLIRALTSRSTRTSKFAPINAAPESQDNSPDSDGANSEPDEQKTANQPAESSASVGDEIREVLKRRKEAKEGDLVSGVAEEIGEIEWPAFGKVLGTTGVVIGVIAGSSVVLLTVNAVLAELSDRVFDGKGVQDFFS